MLETHLRQRCQKLLVDPVIKLIAKYSNANFVTLLSLIFGILVAISIVSNHKILAIIFLLLSGYCDMLDGSLARHHDKSNTLGCVFDIVSDRLVEIAVVLGLFLFDPATRGLLCLLMLASFYFCITSFLVIGIFTENQSHKSFFYSIGLIERAEAFLFFGAMIIWPHAFTYLATTLVILVCYTAIQHIYKFANYLKQQNQSEELQ